MSNITYKLAQYKNSNSSYNNFYYPRAVVTGELTTDEMAQNISKRCTLTKADVLACLAAFSEVMNEAIIDGKRVILDGIGSFKAGIVTKKMVEKLEDFNVRECIGGYRINFLPMYNIDANGRHATKLLAGARVSEDNEYASGVNAGTIKQGKYVKNELEVKE